MPQFGDLFADTRGGDRTMRVSYHADRGAVVLSLWAGTVCRGSFRMAAGDVRRLLALLGEINLSVQEPPAGAPRPGGSAPPGASPAPAAAAAPGPSTVPVDQTGDITGTANSIRMSSGPVLGAA